LRKVIQSSEKSLQQFDAGANHYYYDEEFEKSIDRAFAIQNELKDIVEGRSKGSFSLHFQPIYSTKQCRVVSFEALARMRSTRFGAVSPLEFIPIAEKSKLIFPLGNLIIRKALSFLRRLEDAGFTDIGVSINVAATQLAKKDFLATLRDCVDEFHVNASNITLEITESIFISNFNEMNNLLEQIKESGIRISLDDFGTGFSSLSREQELNIDCMKIDKSFIDTITELEVEHNITAEIISMAHKMGHCVVAEGVEDVSQKTYLETHGCDMLQGYLISKPLDEEAALAFLVGNLFV